MRPIKASVEGESPPELNCLVKPEAEESRKTRRCLSLVGEVEPRGEKGSVQRQQTGADHARSSHFIPSARSVKKGSLWTLAPALGTDKRETETGCSGPGRVPFLRGLGDKPILPREKV